MNNQDKSNPNLDILSLAKITAEQQSLQPMDIASLLLANHRQECIFIDNLNS